MTSSQNRLPDARAGGLIDRYVPAALLPYVQLARLDRPTGWWLLLLPCWWSSALAAISAQQMPNFLQLLLLMIGAIAMRGAGCTFNDIVDRDLDAQVERTRGRPIPSGRVSPRQALVFLVLQALVGLAVLLSFNAFTIKLGLLSLIIVAIYPFMKRIMSWPQAVLGLAFAWGGLLGWAGFSGGLTLAPILIYATAIFWTIGYDTIYALQDLRDDSIVGIKSTARFFGNNVRGGVAVCYLIAETLLLIALFLAGAHLLSLIGAFGFSMHLLYQIRAIDETSPTIAMNLFRSNRNAGLILFAGLLFDALWQVWG